MAIVQVWRLRSPVMKFLIFFGVFHETFAESLLPAGLRCPRVEKVAEDKLTSQTRILNGWVKKKIKNILNENIHVKQVYDS